MYYFECMVMGRWSPRTAAERPRTKMTSAGECLRTGEGISHPIRHIVPVPLHMQGLLLNDLQARHAEMERWAKGVECMTHPDPA